MIYIFVFAICEWDGKKGGQNNMKVKQKETKVDKSLTSGSTTMLILRLLSGQDMYGYQMIEELESRSDNVFSLKAGTLYPILHTLEQQGKISSYDGSAENGRSRRYYSLTKEGEALLAQKQEEWDTFTTAVNHVLGGAFCVG